MIKLIKNILNSTNKIIVLMRFIAVGIFNTLHNFLWYTLFLSFNVHYIISYTIAYIICIVASYYINCYFVFKVKPEIKTFLAFPLSSIPGFIISSIGIYVLIDILKVNEYISNFLAAIIAFPVTFIVVKFILKTKTDVKS